MSPVKKSGNNRVPQTAEVVFESFTCIDTFKLFSSTFLWHNFHKMEVEEMPEIELSSDEEVDCL